MGPIGLKVWLRPVQMGPLTFVFILSLMMVTIIVLTIFFRNTSLESARMFDELSKVQLKYKVCYDELKRQKEVYARLESINDDTKQELGDCVSQLKLLKDSEKISIGKIEDDARNISEHMLEIKNLQRSIVLIKQNHQDLKKEKEKNEQICIQKKNQLQLRAEKQLDESQEREEMYQRTIKSLEIELKMLQRENQALQQWQPQQEQHLKRLIDQLLQQKCQHQGQQQQQQQQEEEELIGNMQKLTQNQQRQDLIENQSHDQQRSDLRGQKYEFIQSQQRRDQNQKIVHGEMKNSMQKQQELQKEGKILQIQSQIQEKKDEGWQWNHGTGNFDQNTLKKQRNGKEEALRPHAPTISSLLKINVDRVPDHRTDGSGSRSGRPEIQNISPGIQSAAASPGASVVNGQRGILPNVKGKGASNRENLVGNTSQQQQGVPRLPVRLGGIAGSSDHNGGSEAGEANWDEKHWNAKKRVNGSEPVDYELEELDKSGYHLDDYENKE